MKPAKILSIGPLPQNVIERFSDRWEVAWVPDSSREEVLEAVGPDVVLIIARGSVMLDGVIMDRAPNLKAIARTGVGYDTVSIEDATARKLPVLYTPGAMTKAVAELAVGFMIGACKRLTFWREALEKGDWDSRYRTMSRDLQGATLGIIGYGRIGRQVRRLVRPFEMTVLANDPYIDHDALSGEEVEFVDLEEILSRSSIVTLHVPLTEETRALINRRNIYRIQPRSILINTARGSVIEDLDLLVDELESGRLDTVALDVFPDEPPPAGHPIFKHSRALLTGHVAARTPLAQKGILETMIHDSLAVLEGRKPRLKNVVNPEVFC